MLSDNVAMINSSVSNALLQVFSDALCMK